MVKKRSDQVYAFVRSYTQEISYPPHIQEIAAQCALSESQVLACLGVLEMAGHLRSCPDRPRSIRLTARRL